MGTTSAGLFLDDLNNNALPAFSFVTPNLCNDTHDCPIASGDAWLRDWFAKIVASPGYLDGSTVVVLTWDEDERTEGNRIPTIVVSPSTPVGTTSATLFSHYSLLKATEELLGIETFLGHAGDPGTNSMRAAFNL
ncbi:MAG: alkaline phosphatase family protein [Candidatus Limnocylindrales bacterium]